MAWYWIVLITYTSMCSITLVLYLIGIDEDLVAYWSIGIPGFIFWIVTYPLRAYCVWKRSYRYFEKHGISKWQYIFGKRVKDEEK